MLPGGGPILNIGHRGFSSVYPENTLLSFKQALLAGAHGFECDLRMTLDEKIVVFHDDNLERLCGVEGSVETSRWDELKTLKVLLKEPICQFEEILANFPEAKINLEIKSSKYADKLVSQLLKLLDRNKRKHQILISSFSMEILKFAASQLDQSKSLVNLGFIFDRPTPQLLREIQTADWLYSLHPNFRFLDELPLGITLPLWVWTPNNAHHWTSCLSYSFKIEAFISDYPNRLHRFLNPVLSKPVLT